MAGSLNQVMLIGHLGHDPETRAFANGGQVCNLRVATSQRWKDKNTGERRERTEWHSVSIFAEHAARYADQYLRKGSKVYVQGSLETRKWQDQSGQDRYSTEVVVRPFAGEVMGLDPINGNDQSQGSGGYQAPSGYGAGGSSAGSPPSSTSGLDDEIPFAPEWRV